MKRNVFEWICGTMTDATSAIVLTHNIDFLFLQSIVRPRLRKCGYPKLTIFADAACAAGSYRQQRFVLDGLGRHYRVVPVALGSGRRFHPKAILLAGPSKAALAVGSGNVTHGGWSANHEIWATYESDDDGLPAISAFRDYLDMVLNLIPESDSVLGKCCQHSTIAPIRGLRRFRNQQASMGARVTALCSIGSSALLGTMSDRLLSARPTMILRGKLLLNLPAGRLPRSGRFFREAMSVYRPPQPRLFLQMYN